MSFVLSGANIGRIFIPYKYFLEKNSKKLQAAGKRFKDVASEDQ